MAKSEERRPERRDDDDATGARQGLPGKGFDAGTGYGGAGGSSAYDGESSYGGQAGDGGSTTRGAYGGGEFGRAKSEGPDAEDDDATGTRGAPDADAREQGGESAR